jgi:hypothetical protein
MANADVLRRVQALCDCYLQNELDVSGFYGSVCGHLTALEGPGPARDCQEFLNRIYLGWLGIDVDGLVRELRTWALAAAGEAADPETSSEPPA